MNSFFIAIIRAIADFLSSPIKRYLLLIAILSMVTLGDFLYLGLARRTFVFYTVNDGEIVVEDRMVKRSESKEVDIIRYTEEMLLGPVAPDLLPLFPRETKLKTLMYRNGTVYAEFSEHAAMPPEEGGSIIDNFRTFYSGILRNFSYVKDVRFFIEGTAVYEDGFRGGKNPQSFSEI
jgi:hypothetical protein